MRHLAKILTLVLFGSLLFASPTTPASADPGPGGFMSPNVSWVGNIPIDSPGVGARVVDVEDPILGPRTRLYVTGSRGLTIYDVTTPAVPVPLGHLELPHWENEDVEVSADGSRTLISTDILGPMYIVNTMIPAAPFVEGVAHFSGEHTVTCADDACDFVYGRTGDIYDLRDPLLARTTGVDWIDEAEDQLGFGIAQRAHDLNRDDAGYLISDTVPRLMLDVDDPLNPEVVTHGFPGGARLAYQHNNIRPYATRTSTNTNDLLHSGQLVLANGETNFTGFCGGGSGPFATWSAKGFEDGEPMKPIDVFRPINGNWMDGDPTLNAVGCSGHWFTFNETHDVAAAGWYEHGTRFLEISPQGQISEVGYFQPVNGSAFAAYWIDDEYVYVVDFVRGIDILRFEPDGLLPTQAQITESWLAKADAPENPLAAQERYVCSLVQEGAL